MFSDQGRINTILSQSIFFVKLFSGFVGIFLKDVVPVDVSGEMRRGQVKYWREWGW